MRQNDQMEAVMMFVVALALMLATFGIVPASAADCRVTGWTSGYGGAPIFDCSDRNH